MIPLQPLKGWNGSGMDACFTTTALKGLGKNAIPSNPLNLKPGMAFSQSDHPSPFSYRERGRSTLALGLGGARPRDSGCRCPYNAT